jgi:hypothetical protein
MNWECYELNEDEKKVIWAISRTKKTKVGRCFSYHDVRRKKQCHDLDVLAILIGLEDKGLSERMGGGLDMWRMTHLGKLVEHELEREHLESEYPELKRIVRR